MQAEVYRVYKKGEQEETGWCKGRDKQSTQGGKATQRLLFLVITVSHESGHNFQSITHGLSSSMTQGFRTPCMDGYRHQCEIYPASLCAWCGRAADEGGVFSIFPALVTRGGSNKPCPCHAGLRPIDCVIRAFA